MFGLFMWLTLVGQAVPAAPLLIERTPTNRPQLMLLGTPHLANNNRDIANISVEDVMTPARQREIKTMIASLARYKPTRIAIEWPASDQAALDERYAQYRAGTLTLEANERDQIAMRLGAQLGLPRIDAIDWNGMPPGQLADFDYLTWANAHGQGERVRRLRALSQAKADMIAARMRCTTVAHWYRMLNTPAARQQSNRPYFDYGLIGDGQTNPGAVWFGNWYARNLHIFANIVRLAQPGDRILILFGAGHGFLLEQDARESESFTFADPLKYLPVGPSHC